MAISPTAEIYGHKAMPAAAMLATHRARRRRISPETGHALEILGHAIDYLTDEYVYAGGTFSARDAQLQAIQLLMAVNRQIYFECPEVPSLVERCRSLLHFRAA